MSIAVEPEATRLSVAVGGREITFETGVVAKQAHGAVLVRQEGTVVLATAVGRTEGRPGADFFPLTVDVEEKMYAAGKIPGGFFKREGRAGEKAILTARMVDRPIRPLWPKGYKNEVQVIITTLSADQVHGHDILGMNGASAALMLSPLPFMGPVGAVRVGRLDGQLTLNPTLVELQDSTLDLVVCGTPEAITMVEAGRRGDRRGHPGRGAGAGARRDQADLPAADRARRQGRTAQVGRRRRHRAAALARTPRRCRTRSARAVWRRCRRPCSRCFARRRPTSAAAPPRPTCSSGCGCSSRSSSSRWRHATRPSTRR